METDMTRRNFVAGLAATAVSGGLAERAFAAPTRKTIWADLIHLGTRMWGSDGVCREADEPNQHFSEKLQCDDTVWRRVTDRLAASGANFVLIDIGEGLRYPSHPELAAKGAWSPEKLSEELKRLRKIGLHPVPKLNFATTHDQWLGVYNRMVGTQKYYEVCRDVINDVCDVFEGTKLFHVGMDEECMDQKRAFTGYGTFRDEDFWFHDLKFYADVIEKRGKRTWMWSDALGDWTKGYLSKCPKSIIQSVGYYQDLFDNEPEGDKHWFWRIRVKNMRLLSENGFDQIPTGSICLGKGNQFAKLVNWCDKELDPKHVYGYLQTSWQYLVPGKGERDNMLAIDHLQEAIKGRAV